MGFPPSTKRTFAGSGPKSAPSKKLLSCRLKKTSPPKPGPGSGESPFPVRATAFGSVSSRNNSSPTALLIKKLMVSSTPGEAFTSRTARAEKQIDTGHSAIKRTGSASSTNESSRRSLIVGDLHLDRFALRDELTEESDRPKRPVINCPKSWDVHDDSRGALQR